MSPETSPAAQWPTLSAGRALLRAGRVDEAEAAFLRAMQDDPESPEALHLLGVVAQGRGHYPEALDRILRALERDPSNADIAYNLAGTLRLLGRMDEALEAYGRALSIRPGFAEALTNRGAVLHALGRPLEALDSYDRALALDPGLVEALDNRGGALQVLGRPGEALSSYDGALALRPDSATLHFDRGNALQALGRHAEAVGSYCRALTLDPGFAACACNRGNALRELGRHTEAVAAYDRALGLDAEFGEARHNRAEVLRILGRLEEALEEFEKADALAPDVPFAFGHYLQTKRQLCAWDELDSMETRLAREIAFGKASAAPGTALATPLTGMALRACAAVYTTSHRPRPGAQAQTLRYATRANPVPRPWGSSAARRLRLGYVSADFRAHPVTHLFTGVLEAHDIAAFDVLLYSTGPASDGPEQARLRAACSAFREVAGLYDEAAAELIGRDRIDILIDLTGITQGQRIGINALRPAPVIVNWLGYAGSLGDPRLADYVIGDPVATPFEHAAHFSETIAQMPHSCLPGGDVPFAPRPERAAAGLPTEAFVFCGFHQAFKIGPAAFGQWCRLLGEVPGSVLWLAEPIPAAAANLRREARARGVDPDRLVFAPRVPALADHLARLQCADLALDTFPYTSHTTGCDALRAGVPLVTRLGETFASRVAASLACAAGVPELVTTDAEACYQRARALALDPPGLAAIRRKLEAQRAQAPLFDTPRFARDLEALYRRMWWHHLDGVREALPARMSGL